MSWFDFSDLVTDHFNMTAVVALRFFDVVNGGVINSVPQPSTLTEIFFDAYSAVPNPPKNFLEQLAADKRERDNMLVWTTVSATPLKTVKLVGQGNASRVYDVQRNKLYIAEEEWPYGRQGNLNGVLCTLIDEPVPTLPPPPV